MTIARDGLPDELRASQPLFEKTGGLHAAALVTKQGSLLEVREVRSVEIVIVTSNRGT